MQWIFHNDVQVLKLGSIMPELSVGETCKISTTYQIRSILHINFRESLHWERWQRTLLIG